MDLDQLKSMGLVSANPLVKKEITIRYRPLLPKNQWADPNVEERQEEEVEGKVTFWLRKLTASDQLAIARAVNEGRDHIPMLLHRCVLKEDGSRVFPTEQDAVGVDPVMFVELFKAINEINDGIGKKSQPRTSSGANSVSPSAEEASPNGERSSPAKNSQSGDSTESETGH